MVCESAVCRFAASPYDRCGFTALIKSLRSGVINSWRFFVQFTFFVRAGAGAAQAGIHLHSDKGRKINCGLIDLIRLEFISVNYL
jgi:hypothetical protein